MLDGGPSRVPQPYDRRTPQRQEPSRRYSEEPQSSTESSSGNPQTSRYEPRQESPKSKVSGRFLKPLIIGLVVLAVALAGWLAWNNLGGGAAATIDDSKNQAVFFAGGQVYFGKLELIDGDHMKLTDVFYIQTGNTDQDSEGENPQQATDGELQLIKLGEEVHGPEDAMIINRDQVLFFENLKDDSRVSQLIQNYNSGN